ncbi:MAG: hypothetical protein ABSE73_21100 [Planctomycetota bacterium]
MRTTAVSRFQRALEVVERLPEDQQEHLVDVIRRRLVEARRKEIAANAKETLKDFEAGKLKRGNARDVMKDLRSCAG